ncbi:MAG: phosphate acyltransferase [Clostridia bacterium]|nr:phosphate acyltransferase [Clostridia bacterium]
MNGFDEVMTLAPRGRTIAVAGAADDVVLKAISEAYKCGIISGGVFAAANAGCEDRARELGLEGFQVVEGGTDADVCASAVRAVRDGQCDILMKGFVQTRDFMRAVLDRDRGLATGRVLSQTGVYEIPGLDRILLMADVGIVISPTLEQKIQIVEGALDVAYALGIARPRVAMLSCVETINPAIPGNADACLVAAMGRRGQLDGARKVRPARGRGTGNPGCCGDDGGAGGAGAGIGANAVCGGPLVDGPLALDNAISPEAASHKGITSQVAGRADILITPDLNSGNMLAKSAIYFAGAGAAGIVTGATRPIVLTSRADSDATKLHSIAVAALMGAYS